MSSVISVSIENFESQIMQASAEKAVVLAFTSAQFPESLESVQILERMSLELNFTLGKVDLDIPENGQFIQVFRISSLPDVRVILKGDIADIFNENLSEAQWREKLSPFFITAEEREKNELKRAIAEKNFENILPKIEAAISKNPEDKSLLILLAQANIHLNQIEEAKEVLNHICASDKEFSEAKFLLELMDFHVEVQKTNVQGTEAVLYHEACVLTLQEKYREAFDQFLSLLQINPEWEQQAAKKAMLTLFGVLGPKHELTWEYRAKLNQILFI